MSGADCKRGEGYKGYAAWEGGCHFGRGNAGRGCLHTLFRFALRLLFR